jgi:hypothetical protein
MPDRVLKVEWKPGEIKVHASSEKRAIDVALEFLRQEGRGLIKVTDVTYTVEALDAVE